MHGGVKGFRGLQMSVQQCIFLFPFSEISTSIDLESDWSNLHKIAAQHRIGGQNGLTQVENGAKQAFLHFPQKLL